MEETGFLGMGPPLAGRVSDAAVRTVKRGYYLTVDSG